MALRKFVTPEVVYGAGSLSLAGTYAHNIGANRVLVVSDAGVTAAGWTAAVTDALREAGLEVHLFTDVAENPRLADAARGAELARAAGCDALVAVGGGSPIDCAKAIGVVLANGGSAADYEGVDRIERAIPPLLCVPTTCGSAAEVSQFAILTDLERRKKLALVSKALVPDVALVDPSTLETLAPAYVAATSLDALVHGIEAFVSNAHGPLTDVHALAAVELVWTHLLPALAPDGAVHRAQLAAASLHAGCAFSNASLGAVHGMAHALGGLADNPHGEANAMLLDHVVAYSYEAAPERFDAVAARIGLDLRGLGASGRRARLLEALRERKREVGLALRLRDRGVHRTDLGHLAENALRDPCVATAPRQPTRGDLETLYAEAL